MGLEAGTAILLVIATFAAITVWKGIRVVPQQEAWIVERLGKFHSLLTPGLNIIIPYIDNVAYRHSLKEEANNVQSQAAITNDNVTLTLDGVLYTRIIDPKQASYGIADPYFALTQLAQTTMRSEIGKMTWIGHLKSGIH
jgi:regulator of protease activity HflC (stomatin/prohibitin superfamily)